MAEELITKRLHVSGLTPAITPADLSQKLGSFGAVTALDGFGAHDALGRPRPFGYITLQTTKAKLARCMNLLSGVTWKGAQLRLGEAKPDFRERLAKEREAQDGEPPRKRRRLPRGVQGVHAEDMSLVTPENVAQRGGWKVTPLGRLVRPIRMRPEHPLPPPIVAAPVKAKSKEKEKDKGKTKERKRRAKEPPTRARKRTIDPLRYGSQQVKGVFLESLVVEPRKEVSLKTAEEPAEESSDEGSETAESGEEAEDTMQVEEELAPSVESSAPKEKPRTASPPATSIPAPTPATAKPAVPKPSTSKASGGPDLTQEKNAALGLLQSLFGDDDKNWGGEEDLSDVDMDELAGEKELQNREFDDDIEFVPAAKATEKSTIPTTAAHDEGEGAGDEEEDEEEEEEEDEESVSTDSVPPPQAASAVATQAAKPSKLKDLFAPREEEAGFSLLGHLDLDDELVDDLDPAFASQTAPTASAVDLAQPVSLPVIAGAQTRFTLDPAAPLFFPVPRDERSGFRGRVKDPLDVAKEKGWDWRSFRRTQTSEEIKQKWEAQKVELTQDWKRRHREAIKSRRRRGGGGDGE
ncbi:hypothetical protein PsYK624_093770 [Phanerochaete sordida]|uniref:RRM domain-containing protein n=1 Tax=Phanerochaete sordida TaxID=48140 RepID=A0A9P3GE41_9APHY|nr:hypothetical protein PsYK624_093770 [Phanerochaete sordida]